MGMPARKQQFHYSELPVYRRYVAEIRRLGLTKYEIAEREEIFTREARKGEWAAYEAICDELRFLIDRGRN